jgi:hypothetical protein
MKHKKYILFGYYDNLKEGGVEDIVDSFDTTEEARRAENDEGFGISYIIDRDTWEDV